MNVKGLLLVEDNPEDVELILTALQDNNLANRVVVVNDGAEALDYLRRTGNHAGREADQPAVVLLDLKLPKVDGLQVLREMRADPALKLIPVVIMTSSRQESDLVEGYRLGTNAYVVKPIDFGQFVESVKNVGLFWAVINEPPPRT